MAKRLAIVHSNACSERQSKGRKGQCRAGRTGNRGGMECPRVAAVLRVLSVMGEWDAIDSLHRYDPFVR